LKSEDDDFLGEEEEVEEVEEVEGVDEPFFFDGVEVDPNMSSSSPHSGDLVDVEEGDIDLAEDDVEGEVEVEVEDEVADEVEDKVEEEEEEEEEEERDEEEEGVASIASEEEREEEEVLEGEVTPRSGSLKDKSSN